MSPELDRRLVEKYPLIFTDRHKDMQVTAMCWGFECGDGWYTLIDTLCYALQSFVTNNKHLKPCQPIATQVKEKFGGLRFYIIGIKHPERTEEDKSDSQYDYLVGHIRMAEMFSETICEECGLPGKLRKRQMGGWYKTVCDNHAKELGYN